VKDFIRNLAPSRVDLLLEKGQSQLESLHWQDATSSFEQFLVKSPGQPAGLLGLLKSSLMQGNYTVARHIVEEFPSSPEYARMEHLRPLLDALSADKFDLLSTENPLDAAFGNALRLTTLGNLPAAMDGLIDILKQDKHYRDDSARKVLLGLFEVLSDNHPLTVQYRQELAMAVF
jgi:putative thioredoxin